MEDPFIAELMPFAFATEWDADVEHSRAGAGFDRAAAEKRVGDRASLPMRISALRRSRFATPCKHLNFYPGNHQL